MKVKDLVGAISSIEDSKSISEKVIIQALSAGLEKGYRKHINCPDATVRVEVGSDNEIHLYQIRTVVEDVDDDEIELSLEDAQERNPEAQIGDIVEDEVSITDFGRSTVTLVKNVMMQNIKEATKQVVYDEYIDKVHDMVVGTVQTVEDKFVLIDLGKTLAIMLNSDKIPGERYYDGQRLKVVIKSVSKESKGSQVVVSRASADLVKRLFETTVPEIYDGTVEIKAIAREANERTKMAVKSNNPNVDAIGACIGPRGSRVVAVIDEITQKGNPATHENIDIVEWSNNYIEYVKNVLKPAEVLAVIPDEKTGNLTVIVEDNQLSIAIGKKGINARLAVKLLNRKVDIKTKSQAEDLGIDWQTLMLEATAKEAARLRQEEIRKQEKQAALRAAEQAKLQEALAAVNAAEEEDVFDEAVIEVEEEAVVESLADLKPAEKVEEPVVETVETAQPEVGQQEAVEEETAAVQETVEEEAVVEEETVEKEAAVQEEPVVEQEETVEQQPQQPQAEEEKETSKRRKPTYRASDYVSKYESLADAKKEEKTTTSKKKKYKSKEDIEEQQIKEKIANLKNKEYEIKPEYSEEELEEFENAEEEHWYDDDVDYDEYDEFYDED